MKKFILSIVLGLSSYAAQAIPEYDVQCENCASYSQAAKDYHSWTSTLYKVNVLDIANKTVLTYKVQIKSGGGFPFSMPQTGILNQSTLMGTTKTVTQIATDSYKLSEWNSAMNTIRNMEKEGDIPNAVVSSAWDLVGNTTYQNSVWNYINAQNYISTEMTHAWNGIVSVFDVKFLKMTVDLSYTLEGGGRLIYNYSYTTMQDGNLHVFYTLNMGESTDKNGNPLNLTPTSIPDGVNPLQFAGESANQDWNQFQTALERINYSFYGGGGGSYLTVCFVKGNQTVTCEISRH
jgi:hypothetical protein